MSRKPIRLSEQAAAALAAYQWPGNVRELQNAIERAVVVTRGQVLEASDLPLAVTAAPRRRPCGSLEEVERAHVESTLEECNWNISHAARVLDVDRATLYSKIHKWSLKRPDDERAQPQADSDRR